MIHSGQKYQGFDPVAVAIKIKPGEVAEITKSSPTSLTTKYYRLCK